MSSQHAAFLQAVSAALEADDAGPMRVGQLAQAASTLTPMQPEGLVVAWELLDAGLLALHHTTYGAKSAGMAGARTSPAWDQLHAAALRVARESLMLAETELAKLGAEAGGGE